MTLTTSGPLVEHPTTPQLTYQLKPVADLVRDLVRTLPRPSTPKGVRHGR